MAVKGQTITFAYRGSFPDGEVFDDHTTAPMQIMVGRGQVMKALENVLIDMEIGEERTVELAAKDAYGEYDPRNVVQVPRDQFPGVENAPLGVRIMLTGPGGQPLPAVIKSFDDKVVNIDLNHELAGQHLTFEIELLSAE